MSTYVSKEKLVLNGTIVTIMHLCGMAVSFFLMPIFIRKMGSGMYGIWLIPNIALGQLGFLDLGFSSGIARNLATSYATGDQEEFSQSIWAGLSLLCCIGLIIGGTLFFGEHFILTSFHVAPEHLQMASRYLRTAGACLIIEWPLHIFRAIHKAGMLERYTTPIAQMNTIILHLIYIVLLLCNVLSLSLFKLINFVMTLLNAIIAVWIIRKYMPEVHLLAPKKLTNVIVKIAPYSLGTFFYSIISYLAIGIDTFLLGIFTGPTAITIYHIITKFFTIIQSLTFSVMNNFLVAVIHIDAVGDRARLERFLHTSIKARLFIVCSMVFPAILILPAFVQCWVGEEFSRYAVWGQLYLLVPICSCLGQANVVLRGCGELKFVNTVYSCSCTLNFLLSLIAVRRLGVGGVILGTVLAALLVGDILLFPICCKKLRFQWRPTMQYFAQTFLLNLILALLLFMPIRNLPVCWSVIFPSAALLGTVFLSFNWFVVLDKQLKQSLWEMVSNHLQPIRQFIK